MQQFVPREIFTLGNREQLVGMLEGHLCEAAGMSMTRFRAADYPLLLIVMKTNGGFNVVSTLQANNSLDELMSALLNGYEVQPVSIKIRACQLH